MCPNRSPMSRSMPDSRHTLAPPTARTFELHEARLSALDDLPRPLWLGGVTHSIGALEGRLGALAQWREALLNGRLPDERDCAWPPPPVMAAVAGVFAGLGLTDHCEGRDALVDTVLQSLLFHLDLIVDYRDRGAPQDQALARALAAFEADWAERCGDMRALTELFGDLGDLLKHTRWDLLHGLLRSSDWRELLRIHRVVGELPELVALIRRLGRSRASDAPAEAAARAVVSDEQASVSAAADCEVRVPELPGQTRGVHRSGRIARMLPSEAWLLGHAVLRLVWHARRAERSLLAYEDDDVLRERRPRNTLVSLPIPRMVPDRQRETGPMLLCVDTSGSMQGGAEAVAKAVVLEAMRCAQTQRRACHVFAFSGPDELIELELNADAEDLAFDGLERVTRFLGQSFGGGTDICGVLERMLARLEDTGWQLADLLIASDGEFGATPELAARLAHARSETGLRVQGVLIGDRETIGLHELCDDIHWVGDWRRLGGGDQNVPVHSSRLTAAYFPGALRTPDAAAQTRDGRDAAAAIRAGHHAAAQAAPMRHDGSER